MDVSPSTPASPRFTQSSRMQDPSTSHSRAGPSHQRTRFEPPRWSTAWEKFKRQLTPASHPSTTSESAIDSSFATTDNFFLDSDNFAHHNPTLDLLNPLAGTSSRHKKRDLRKRSGKSKSSVANSNSRYGDDEDQTANSAEPVNHVVVETDFDHVIPPAARSDGGSTTRTPNQSATKVSSGLGLFSKASGADGGEDGDEGEAVGSGRKDKTEVGSIRRDRRKSWLARTAAYEFVVERAWPNFAHFLDSSFPEESKERAFQKESWFMNKAGAMASSAYLLIAWILSVSLLPMPLTTFNWITYVGLAALFTIPTVFFVIFDYPRLHNRIYQPILACATWIFADILIVEMRVCGFFSFNNQCGSRNFLNMLGFAFGQPVLALMALRQNRAWAMAGAAQWVTLVGALLMTEDNYPTLFYRNVILFAFFHAFIIGTSFLKERSDRQMFALRQQLKIQYRATQSAQVMERRASDSKKRFVSYIFHEVRVPLNTALLAVQNLDGEHVFKGLQEDQAEMVHGLMGSLTMMEKVLNDVLSFNRMESGKFAQARKPFGFHKSIQLVALSHRMQAQMAGIELIVDLDSAIDKIGGMFIGDEMRLRQVTSNLVSNSIKFTEQGSVRIVTKLLYPRIEPTPSSEIDDPLKIAAENAQAQIQHLERGNGGGSGDVSEKTINPYAQQGADTEKGSIVLENRRHSHESSKEREKEERRKNKAVIRVEIHDTGVGLRKQDVIENRLFSPYVQTEIGRRQGGKGSGLGLALVRQIVKLSNGRLGVESQYGKGSMFWFELPYSLPSMKRDSQTLGFGLNQSPRMDKGRFSIDTPQLDKSTASHSEFPLQPPIPSESTSSTSISGVLATATGQSPRRPPLSVSGSNMPLLSYHPPGPARPYDNIPLDELVASTFSPPLSLTPDVQSPISPSDSTPSGSLVRMTETDPFTLAQATPAGDRRSSEWSVATKIDPNGSPERLQQLQQRQAAAESSQQRPAIALTVPSGAGGQIQSPLSPSGPQGLISPVSPTSLDGESPMCTLVVDDDKLTRMLMSRMLKRLGHQVTTAENGKIALELITGSFRGAPSIPKFDIVFLDNQMPLMSGVEVAQHVRDMGCHLFIVGCTGNALREDQEEYITAGADDIITKPIHQKAVLEAIKEARKRVAGETEWSPPRDGEIRERRGSHA